MKTTQLKSELKSELTKRFSRCNFTNSELENAIDLAIRRGAESNKEIIKEAINFLYC